MNTICQYSYLQFLITNCFCTVPCEYSYFLQKNPFYQRITKFFIKQFNNSAFSEAYSEPSKPYKLERFVKITDDF